MNKELICIVCPRGCHLTVDDNLNVTGNTCKRGEIYGKQEVTSPTRTVTSTVKIKSVEFVRLPIKTKDPIPKGMIFDLMEVLEKVEVEAPIHIGDVVVSNVLNTGVDIVACREVLK